MNAITLNSFLALYLTSFVSSLKDAGLTIIKTEMDAGLSDDSAEFATLDVHAKTKSGCGRAISLTISEWTEGCFDVTANVAARNGYLDHLLDDSKEASWDVEEDDSLGDAIDEAAAECARPSVTGRYSKRIWSFRASAARF